MDEQPLRLLIADDEPLAAERLQLLLAQIPDVDLIGTASDGEGAVRMADALSPDALLLDIEMPGLDGIEVARALASKKPLGGRHLHHRLRSVRGRRLRGGGGRLSDEAGHPRSAETGIEARPRSHPAAAKRLPRRARTISPFLEEFWASDLSGLVRIASRDVDRVSAERDYMRLHVGRRSWLIHHSMNALEEGLDPELFVRLHRSAIVRKDFIAGFTRNPSGRWIARLGDGVEQPVGRLYTDKVRTIAKR